MRMSFRGGSLSGTVSPPPSKSHTHRAFFLAAMAKGKSEITNALLSDDTRATLKASEAMGARITVMDKSVIIDGGKLHPPSHIVDANNSGTTMRIFSGLSSMFYEDVMITGDASLQKRPMGPLLEALSQTGTICRSSDGMPPVTIRGPNTGGDVRIMGNVSSQFITSIMMVSPMLPNDSHITIEGKPVSEPYLDVTSCMMKQFGADVKKHDNMIDIRGNTGYTPNNYHVPSDFSSAAFPLVAGALSGKVKVTGLNMEDPQGDRKIVDILERAGSVLDISTNSITSERNTLKPLEIDMGDIPDLFPIVAVLLSTANGISRLHGAPQLRFKESDRIETTVSMLKAIGADIEGTDDGCIIKGKKKLSGGNIDNKGDHRIMMAAAVASLICEKPVTMDDAECCSVSYPRFIEDMRSLGMNIEE